MTLILVFLQVCYLNFTPQQQNFQGFQDHTPQQHEFQGFQSHIPQHEFPGFDSHPPQHHELPGFENHKPESQDYQGFENCNGVATTVQGSMINNFEPSDVHNMVPNNFSMMTQLDFLPLDEHQNLDSEIFISSSGIENWGMDVFSDFSSNVNPPPSAFLGPKCALWDCVRPAKSTEICRNYCSGFHAELAVKECPPGSCPILRPGGIGLKDGPLFVALKSKLEGKDVGIPECLGAASAKSPWNTPGKHIIVIKKMLRI